MKTQARDFSEVRPNTFTRTNDGYLTGRMCVTGAGVFRYMDASGNYVHRVRPVDEVGEATHSLNSIPMTLHHPGEDVSPENAKELSVGMSANDAYFDGLNSFVTVTITDKEAIRAIEAGEVEAFSSGYDTNLVMDEGNWQGSDHTERMTDISYNHIALVKKGRAGDSVTVKIGDSADYEKLFNTAPSGSQIQKDSAMKKMIIDGVQHEADEAVVSAYQAMKKNLGDSETSVTTLTKERDTAQGKLDAANIENETLKKTQTNDSAINDAVNAKITLISKAKDYDCEVKAEDSALVVQTAVIKKAFGDETVLEGKSEDYVGGMFDTACQVLDAKAVVSESNTFTDGVRRTKTKKVDPEASFEKMRKKLSGEKGDK